MTARAKIEWLTHSWYGFAIFAGLLSLWNNGLGLLSLFWAASTTAISLFVTFLIGKSLLAKSSMVRKLMIVITALLFVLCSLAVGKQVLSFFSGPFNALLWGVFYGAAAVLHLRSLRTLKDKSVKAYFG